MDVVLDNALNNEPMRVTSCPVTWVPNQVIHFVLSAILLYVL